MFNGVMRWFLSKLFVFAVLDLDTNTIHFKVKAWKNGGKIHVVGATVVTMSSSSSRITTGSGTISTRWLLRNDERIYGILIIAAVVLPLWSKMCLLVFVRLGDDFWFSFPE